jgi:hypothetical protein
MTDPLAKLNQIISNRVAMAQRWHGLRIWRM